MTSKMTSEKCNEPRDEELCGVRVENFSLVGKRSTTGSSTTRTNAVSFAQLVQCCQVANATYERIHMQHLFQDSNHTCAQQ